MKKCIAVLLMVVMLSGVAGLAEEFCIEDEVVIEEIEIGSDIEDILPELDVIVDAALLVTNDDFNEISNEQTFEGITSNVSDVAISEANFPDSAFRAYVQKNCDTNGDGLLSVNEAGAVTGMYLVNHGISSLRNTRGRFAVLTGQRNSDDLSYAPPAAGAPPSESLPAAGIIPRFPAADCRCCHTTRMFL